MRNRLSLAFLGMVALSFAAMAAGQEPQNKPPADNVPNKSADKPQEKWSEVERRIRQIEEETKRQIEQLGQQKKKVEAQAKVQLEQLDVEAKKMMQQAQTRVEELMRKVKEVTVDDKAPEKPAFVSPARSVGEKLDMILDRLDKIEQRLDQLEKRTPQKSPKPK